MSSYYAASFVKESSSTSGTGDYTLGGASTGFATFASAFQDGVYTTYSATDGTNWEVGIGKYNAGANSLTRIKVLNSSAGGGAVSWSSAVKTICCTPIVDGAQIPFSGAMPALSAPFISGSSPTTSSDFSQGFTPGTFWKQVSGVATCLYICTDATVGAAVWKNVVIADGTNSAIGKAYASCLSGLAGNAVRVGSAIIGAYGSGASGERHQRENIALAAYTTSATPANMLMNSADATSGLFVSLKSGILVDANIIAFSEGSTLVSGWKLTGLVRRGSSGAPVIVGSPTLTMLYQDSGASAWTVGTSIDSTNNLFLITVTGAASTTISWTADIRIADAAAP